MNSVKKKNKRHLSNKVCPDTSPNAISYSTIQRLMVYHVRSKLRKLMSKLNVDI